MRNAYTHEELLDRFIKVFPSGEAVIIKMGAHVDPERALAKSDIGAAYIPQGIAPEMQHVINASLVLYHAVWEQQEALRKTIDYIESIGGAIEHLVPTLTTMMAQCDLARFCALNGVNAGYDRLNAAKPR